jgi:GDPmannose 4,6-dehydratase
MVKSVLITGITGQDGLYMTAFILKNQPDWTIHGIVRKNSLGLPIVKLMSSEIILHYGDVTDSHFMLKVIADSKPFYVYNFAAQSHVQHSFGAFESTFNTNTAGLLNICQSLVFLKLTETRVLQASTSEMFG